MKPIANFSELISHLDSSGKRQRVAVISGVDDSTLYALHRALDAGFISVVFVGQVPCLDEHPEFRPFEQYIEFRPAEGEDAAAALAVSLVRSGEADFLMKGLIHTDNLLHAVLHKEKGLLPRGEVLTHVAVAETAAYNKLLFFSDPAVMPVPARKQREAQVRYIIRICHAFGIATPRIALIHFTEKVSEKFPCTIDYQDLAQESRAGRWGTAIIDGPLDVRTSVDPEAMRVKGIDSPIAGRADALVFPDLEAANAFYKTLSFFANAEQAGMLLGTVCPVVVSSRGDDGKSKFFSLAMASVVSASDVAD